jgi:hypothetical protein
VEHAHGTSLSQYIIGFALAYAHYRVKWRRRLGEEVQ